ncbi:MAG: cytochrome c [Nitrospirota bacterium]|nr:cytochrome c [Nitrospirota bacterium]
MSASWRTASALVLAALSAACTPTQPPAAENYDPRAVVARVLALTPDPEAGRAVFRSWCIFCHGDQQAGEPPTDFGFGDENPRRFRGYAGLTPETHVTAIVEGFVSASTGHRNMPPFGQRLSAQDIANVAGYERWVTELAPGAYWERSMYSWWPEDPPHIPGVPPGSTR